MWNRFSERTQLEEPATRICVRDPRPDPRNPQRQISNTGKSGGFRGFVGMCTNPHEPAQVAKKNRKKDKTAQLTPENQKGPPVWVRACAQATSTNVQ